MKNKLFRSWPLWRQLLIALGASLLLVNWVATTTYKNIEKAYMTNEVEQRSLNTLSLLSSTLIDATIVEDQPVLNTIVDQVMIHSPNIFSICIKNEDGMVLAEKQRGKKNDQQMLKSQQQKIELEGETFGGVHLEWDHAPLYAEIDNHIAEVKIYATLMLVLLAGLIVLLVNYLAVGPVQKISRYLNELALGESPDPLKIETNHEIESLATSANQLAQFLRHQYEREIELLHTREQLQIAHDAALSSNKAKSIFLATMSHEIRTPMNAILGILDLVSDTKIDESQKQLISTGQDAGHLLLSIINDILDFSKMDANKLELEKCKFDLYSTFSNTIELVRPLAEEKSLHLELHIDPDLPKVVVGDSNRLRQIVLNLVNNAVKFTCNGGVNVRVDFTSEIDGKFDLHCTVEDTGDGIPLSKQSTLFKEFTQVDQSYSRSHEGTGLGLAICKQLVALMNGQISCDSSIGQGSTFSFIVELESVCCSLDTKAQMKPISHALPDVGTRILLVEDNQANQLVIRRMLECAGLKPNIVSNGLEALNAVQSTPYDIVLMDISMPVMDGISATQAIRSLPGPEHSLPIIALTAHVPVGDRQLYIDAGMNGHLVKPVSRKDVLSIIAHWTSSYTSQGQMQVGHSNSITESELDGADVEYVGCQTLR